ncbi:MAG: hypothetical protein KAS32_10680 [Candidatus Peribacteraceae bacterium]|nr:hypothetical protein [Candidatus Peribacteraceae bacterium]
METEKNQTTHLTHTGYYAGVTLCGVPRNNTDRYTHAIYADRLNPEKFTICKKCQAIWDICSVCEENNCDVCKKLQQ